MKIDSTLYLKIQFGPAYKKKTWDVSLVEVAYMAGEKHKISKAEVKRLIKQKGVEAKIIRYAKIITYDGKSSNPNS